VHVPAALANSIAIFLAFPPSKSSPSRLRSATTGSYQNFGKSIFGMSNTNELEFVFCACQKRKKTRSR
jgi:hypothetical protein